jgi:hypothetical protein
MTDVSSFGLTFLLREDWNGRLGAGASPSCTNLDMHSDIDGH